MKPVIKLELADDEINALEQENEEAKEIIDCLEKQNSELKNLLLRCKPYLSEWITPMDILAEIDKLEEK